MDKKNKNTIVVPAAKVRNAFALHAKQRKAGYMKDRRAERGGSRNNQRDYLDKEKW